MRLRSLLLAALLLSLTVLAARVSAGPVGICCVCECGSAGTSCTTALGPNFCDEFLASGCGLMVNATCDVDVVGSPCDAIPACAGAAPQAAPAAGASVLAAMTLLLATLAAWRLRGTARRH